MDHNDDCYLCDGCGEIETTDRETNRVTVPCPECISREIAAERANRAAVSPQGREAKPLGYVNLETLDFAVGFFKNDIPDGYIATYAAANTHARGG